MTMATLFCTSRKKKSKFAVNSHLIRIRKTGVLSLFGPVNGKTDFFLCVLSSAGSERDWTEQPDTAEGQRHSKQRGQVGIWRFMLLCGCLRVLWPKDKRAKGEKKKNLSSITMFSVFQDVGVPAADQQSRGRLPGLAEPAASRWRYICKSNVLPFMF